MGDLAARLMMHNQDQQSNVPTAIFGSAGSVRHALQIYNLPTRIGFWPIKSADNPEVAMGLLSFLGYLLERYPSIRVYQLMARVDGLPETYSWSIEQSQFEVDDWQIENLDDNVGIWGTLNDWNLALEIESDLSDSDAEDTHTLNYGAGSLAELARLLPQIASDIATFLDAGKPNPVAPLYSTDDWGEAALAAVIKQVFHWERRLYLWLWGQEWSEDQILADVDHLLALAQPLGDLGAWLTAHTLTRAIVFMGVEDEFLVPEAEKIIETFKDCTHPAAILSVAVFEAKQPQLAYEWLETEFGEGKGDASTYLLASELYRRGGQITEAISVVQAAIEDQLADAALFRQYAYLLNALIYNGLKIDDYVLIASPRRSEGDVLREGVEAYERALQLEPDNPATLSLQLQQIQEIGGGYELERHWRNFDRLVEIDTTGEYIRSLIDVFYNLEDLTPAIDCLKQHIQQKPERVDLLLSLATVYTLDDNSKAALNVLNQARQMTTDADSIAEIERLQLAAEDPEFEMTLGEITSVISAGNNIDAEDVEFLEHIIEKVPGYTEIYLLLAKAYLGWGESSSALETLLDGHNHDPDDPDILALLSEVLWASGETDLAFSYLNKGISKNPQHVPLLALAGQYLFEDGQEEAAKAYLRKADAISPNNSVLVRVRRDIARSLR